VELACSKFINRIAWREAKRCERTFVGGVPLDKVDLGGEVWGDGVKVEDGWFFAAPQECLTKGGSSEAGSSNDNVSHVIHY
jgi:hypothetical protein